MAQNIIEIGPYPAEPVRSHRTRRQALAAAGRRPEAGTEADRQALRQRRRAAAATNLELMRRLGLGTRRMGVGPPPGTARHGGPVPGRARNRLRREVQDARGRGRSQ
eukprot:393993-Hanusia_phi.AAC.2